MYSKILAEKIYICYVLYMVCIVFVKMNQNHVLQE